MRTLLASVTALAIVMLPGVAQGQTLRTVGDLRRVPMATLADAMLPKGHPTIAHVAFETAGNGLGGIETVSFYSVARAVTHDFCAQDEIRIRVGLGDDDHAPLTAIPKPIGDEAHMTLYRYRMGGECDSKGQSFGIYQTPIDWAMDAIRTLKTAFDRAASDQKLPFELTCHQEYMSRCDARAMLAELDFGTIESVSVPPESQFQFHGELGKAAKREGDLYSVTFRPNGAVQIDVTILMSGDEIARIDIGSGTITY